jgi:flavin reductase (DIM6/NTAB) family NADH-FMN oxidoreductase RutF
MKKSLGAQAMPLPAPVWVIGSYDKEGKPNVMTAAWAGTCASEPPCVTVSIRKSRYSYECIVARKAFTVNVPSEQHVRVTDYFGIVSGRDQDKLAKAGLTAVASDLVDAPYIKEFPAVMECKLLQTVEVGSHTLFIGRIMDVKIEESLIAANGHLDAGKLRLFVLLDGYRRLGEYVAQPYVVGKGK